MDAESNRFGLDESVACMAHGRNTWRGQPGPELSCRKWQDGIPERSLDSQMPKRKPPLRYSGFLND
jgi:hypothetical protein